MTKREFTAVLYDEAHRGGLRIPIQLGESAIEATTTDGQSYAIAYAECQIERGGANGQMWFCRNAARDLTLMCGEPEFAAALRGRAPGELAAAIDAVEQRSHQRQRRTTVALVLIAAVSLLVLIGGYFGVRAAGRASVRALPPSLDVQLGEQAIATMPLEGPVLADTPLPAAVHAIVDRLKPHAEPGFEFKVRVVDAPIVNAFALPGGPIVVYTGLLAAAESPEQVAGVIAHEMAHVTRRHGIARIGQSLGVIAAFQLVLGDVSGLAGLAVNLLREGAVNSYSREQEHEADLVGVRTMAHARLDPRGLAEFLVRLEKEHRSLPQVLTWLSTHPDTSQRVAQIDAESSRLRRTGREPFEMNWAELKREAKHATK